MKNNLLIEKILNSKIFHYESDIFVQKKSTISMYDINEKEKVAMDKAVSKEKISYKSDLDELYTEFSEKTIVLENASIINELKLTSYSLAIDCGCGTGVYLEYLVKKFDFVIAIDLSLDALMQAKETYTHYNNIIYINGSMLDLYKIFNEPIADFCLSAEVIEHVPSPKIYLSNIYDLLKPSGKLLISTPCQNLYFYPLQFISMVTTKPNTLYKLLHPLEHWNFALNWHPALSKKDFLTLLSTHHLTLEKYENFVPYYFDKFPIMFYIAKIIPKKYSYLFYRYFLEKYNLIIKKIGFGIRQHALLEKGKYK